ncbi:hypothetical protein H9Q74_008093 [Fusarium xylarioides]|nr:hypothetical protein H9Q71_007688 [Fusarium xylarioides]KAG5821709.1 hypothetical protein H9Q74_008093 [Fusarium xylarioides]
MKGHGDLNNPHAGRTAVELTPDPAHAYRSLAIDLAKDDPKVREKYRPFILEDKFIEDDWVAELELSTAIQMAQSEILDKGLDRLRILVLYGSLRSRSYSRLLAFEASRILHRLGCYGRL